jgi:GNAT superfamily N-acetyltransferase
VHGLTVVTTGLENNTLNGVYGRPDGDLEPAVQAVLALVDRLQAPAIWHDPDGDPALRSALVAAGAAPEDDGVVRGGAVEAVRAALRAAGVAAGPRERPVLGASDLDRWTLAYAPVQGTDDTPAELADLADLWRRLGFGEAQPVRHWVAATAGRSAAGYATACFDGEVCLLHLLGVVPAVRRQRVAARLLLAVTDEAARRGCRWLVLGPTPESAPFYERWLLREEPVTPGLQYYLPKSPAPP